MTTFYTEQTVPGLSYVRLCNQADHFSSTYGDKGWGCGYRNLQILLSSLAHIAEYQRVVFNGKVAYDLCKEFVLKVVFFVFFM